MRLPIRRLASLAVATALSLASAAGAGLAADAAHGKRVFQSCASCHAAETENNKFGPSLKGVVGRRAASVPGFGYSAAMRQAGEAGLIWDTAALSAFLSSPRRKVPGTSMRFWGLWSQGEIDDVIAYLESNP